MKARILVLLAAVAAPTLAHAQDPVAQVPQTVARNAAAAAPEQIGPPSVRDRAAVTQLPSGLAERSGARPETAPPPAPASGLSGLALSPAGSRSGSVDADEIARLLARGEAASIDAAAAVALGAAEGAAAQSDEAIEDRQARARAGGPHAVVISGK